MHRPVHLAQVNIQTNGERPRKPLIELVRWLQRMHTPGSNGLPRWGLALCSIAILITVVACQPQIIEVQNPVTRIVEIPIEVVVEKPVEVAVTHIVEKTVDIVVTSVVEMPVEIISTRVVE